MNSLVFIFAISGAIIIDAVKFILIIIAFAFTATAIGAPVGAAFYAASKAVGVMGSVYCAAFIIAYSGIVKYRNNKNAQKIVKRMSAKVAQRVGVTSLGGLIPVVDLFPWCCYSVYITCKDRERLDTQIRANK